MTNIFEEKWRGKLSQAAKEKGDSSESSLAIEGNPYYQKYFWEYFPVLQNPQSMKVLDTGCGTGITSRALASKGFEVYGVDYSPEIIEVAKQKAKEHSLAINFRTADAYQLPFPDQIFDVVICLGLFQTLTEPKKAFQEILRVLKPNGRVFITTLNSFSVGKILLRDEVILYNPYRMKSMMEQLGFKNVHFKGVYLFTKAFDWFAGWIFFLKVYTIFNVLFPFCMFFSHSFYIEAKKSS